MTSDDSVLLERGLDQLASLLDQVPAGALGGPTPCSDWSVSDLLDHIVATPERFARMVRGEPIDWAAPTPSAGEDPAGTFRGHAADLVEAVRAGGDGPPVAFQCAELAVHAWDLATALGRPSSELDPSVAESGLGFMRANITDDRRAPAFGPEQPAPDGADAYQRIAAFAGRTV